jgi:hypothetical protein
MNGQKMPKALRDKWVAALRSGDFGQCQNELRSSDGRYCCLGVLAVVAGEDTAAVACGGYLGRWFHERHGITPAKLSGYEDGMGRCNFLLTIGGKTAFASVHNDSYDRTFAEIADAIERDIEAAP